MDRSTRQFALDVDEALTRAIAERIRVVVIVRGDVAAGREARMIEGIPVAFRPAQDGRQRVVLEVVPGESHQMVLVERIARVTPARPTP